MKKGLSFVAMNLVVLVLAFAFVQPKIATAVQQLGGYAELLSNTTFNNVTTATNTTGYLTLINEKTAFFVKYVESGAVANLSLTVTPQISYDNSNWINMTFYDIAGGATLQTGETIASNSTYYFWFPDAAVVPYSRINMVAVNSTASDTMSVQAYIVGSINPGNR
ncbi:MAG: hypothetical protein C4540_04545 [Candidatus Omnitrophota bacterium]|jgi:hypothetical protein|nr:MAG: hypothetical protein C4540_04545 [Candidatus Omnitrophota bacterium]